MAFTLTRTHTHTRLTTSWVSVCVDVSVLGVGYIHLHCESLHFATRLHSFSLYVLRYFIWNFICPLFSSFMKFLLSLCFPQPKYWFMYFWLKMEWNWGVGEGAYSVVLGLHDWLLLPHSFGHFFIITFQGMIMWRGMKEWTWESRRRKLLEMLMGPAVGGGGAVENDDVVQYSAKVVLRSQNEFCSPFFGYSC